MAASLPLTHALLQEAPLPLAGLHAGALPALYPLPLVLAAGAFMAEALALHTREETAEAVGEVEGPPTPTPPMPDTLLPCPRPLQGSLALQPLAHLGWAAL